MFAAHHPFTLCLGKPSLVTVDSFFGSTFPSHVNNTFLFYVLVSLTSIFGISIKDPKFRTYSLKKKLTIMIFNTLDIQIFIKIYFLSFIKECSRTFVDIFFYFFIIITFLVWFHASRCTCWMVGHRELHCWWILLGGILILESLIMNIWLWWVWGAVGLRVNPNHWIMVCVRDKIWGSDCLWWYTQTVRGFLGPTLNDIHGGKWSVGLDQIKLYSIVIWMVAYLKN